MAEHAGEPLPSNTPVLLVALHPLAQFSPAVAEGAAFWAMNRDVRGLVEGGRAVYAPADAVVPPL
jgi:hypothetical protein